ncbi:MAG: hypothetical protein AB8H79_00900 [Myxococcota bacterium]
MKRRYLALCLSVFACGAGGSDLDGDGLTRDEEIALGSDPEIADSDGDGVADGAEVTLGLDPTLADTD